MPSLTLFTSWIVDVFGCKRADEALDAAQTCISDVFSNGKRSTVMDQVYVRHAAGRELDVVSSSATSNSGSDNADSPRFSSKLRQQRNEKSYMANTDVQANALLTNSATCSRLQTLPTTSEPTSASHLMLRYAKVWHTLAHPRATMQA